MHYLGNKKRPGMQTLFFFKTVVDLCRTYKKRKELPRSVWAQHISASSLKNPHANQSLRVCSFPWLLSHHINTFQQVSYILMLRHLFYLKPDWITGWGFTLFFNPQGIKQKIIHSHKRTFTTLLLHLVRQQQQTEYIKSLVGFFISMYILIICNNPCSIWCYSTISKRSVSRVSWRNTNNRSVILHSM